MFCSCGTFVLAMRSSTADIVGVVSKNSTAEDQATLAGLLEQRAFRPVIDRRYPLGDAADAIRTSGERPCVRKDRCRNLTCVREASRTDAATRPSYNTAQTLDGKKAPKFPRIFRYVSCYPFFKQL
jgi:hypothetical protein